jgi:NhaC family Na+:H+ antiporter
LAGVSTAITAGAVISGAYLGDKLSPLSETTVLTAQLAEVDLRTHIRAMFWTAGPAFLTAVVIFMILGFQQRGIADGAYITSELTRLNELFWITPLTYCPWFFSWCCLYVRFRLHLRS